MTDIHSCSYYCQRPECIKAQRDELRDRLAQPEQEPLQFKCTVIDDAHPNGVPLSQWGKQPEQEPVAHVYFLDYPSGRPRVAWDNANNIKIGDKLYTAPPQRKKLPPQTPCLLTQAENKMFRFGWLECEAAHGIKGKHDPR